MYYLMRHTHAYGTLYYFFTEITDFMEILIQILLSPDTTLCAASLALPNNTHTHAHSLSAICYNICLYLHDIHE